jgi:hypothetical protein
LTRFTRRFTESHCAAAVVVGSFRVSSTIQCPLAVDSSFHIPRSEILKRPRPQPKSSFQNHAISVRWF